MTQVAFESLRQPGLQLLPIGRDGDVAVDLVGAHEAVAGVLAAMRDLYARRGFVPPWMGYLAVENGVAVGTCGFAAPPDDGVVEIAYFSFPGNEGRGLATRMAAELLALAMPLARQNRYQVIAHTLPEEGPSPVILRKLGFEWLGEIVHPEDGPVWKWRLRSL